MSGRARSCLQAAVVKASGLQRCEFEGVRQLNPGLQITLIGHADKAGEDIASRSTALKVHSLQWLHFRGFTSLPDFMGQWTGLFES